MFKEIIRNEKVRLTVIMIGIIILAFVIAPHLDNLNVDSSFMTGRLMP